MPDFEGRDIIYIQPVTAEYPVRAWFPAALAAVPTAQDEKGAIPINTTIASAVVKSYDADGVEVTDLIDDGSVAVFASVYVDCTLSYPATSGDGVYVLEYRLTLSTGAVIVYDAKRVVAGDRST